MLNGQRPSRLFEANAKMDSTGLESYAKIDFEEIVLGLKLTVLNLGLKIIVMSQREQFICSMLPLMEDVDQFVRLITPSVSSLMLQAAMCRFRWKRSKAETIEFIREVVTRISLFRIIELSLIKEPPTPDTRTLYLAFLLYAASIPEFGRVLAKSDHFWDSAIHVLMNKVELKHHEQLLGVFGSIAPFLKNFARILPMIPKLLKFQDSKSSTCESVSLFVVTMVSHSGADSHVVDAIRGSVDNSMLNEIAKKVLLDSNADAAAKSGVFLKKAFKELTPQKKCFTCRRKDEEKSLKKCGRCQTVYFCNKQCQKKGWKKHKKGCKAF